MYVYTHCMCLHTDAESVTFSGESFIQYEVLAPSSSRRRQVRQTQVYRTGRTYVTLAFITSSDMGTILLMGIDDEEEEYAILEVNTWFCLPLSQHQYTVHVYTTYIRMYVYTG